MQKRMSRGIVALVILASACIFTISTPKYASAEGECPDGFFPTNLSFNPVNNGDFSIPVTTIPVDAQLGRDTITTFYYPEGGFWSQAANVGQDIYPNDIIPHRNQFSLQVGQFDGGPSNELHQVVFPGDGVYAIPSETTWFYSNGNALGDGSSPLGPEYVNWGQQLSGLDPTRQYVFVAYINSLVEPPYNAFSDPIMQLKRGGNPGLPDGSPIGGRITLDELSTSNSLPPLFGWRRVAALFTTESDGSVVLKITDQAPDFNGDDFAITAVTVQRCDPIATPIRRPYMRTYGNDVVAGGGFEDALGICSAVPMGEEVLGFGRFLPPNPAGHSTYVGGGSELGVFASGRIEEFLPGSAINFNRPGNRLDYLSFANRPSGLGVGTSPPTFSGGFQQPLCADAFPDSSADVSLQWNTDSNKTIQQLIAEKFGVGYTGRAYFEVEVPGAPNDYFVLQGGVVPQGVDFRIVVKASGANPENSRLVLSGNVTYAGAGSWALSNQIPTATFYSFGDLLIDHSVTELNGIFNVGRIAHTCTDRENLLDPASDTAFIENNCDDKLTIYGSLTAKDANFYRIHGDLSATGAGNIGEGPGSGNLAEAFVFSPDIYLALLARQSTTSIEATSVDAIRTLPPAL